MVALTEEQIQALESQKEPLKLVNPNTQEVFVLIRQEVYKLTCGIICGLNQGGWDDPDDENLIKEGA